jgi:hypothetical protein
LRQKKESESCGHSLKLVSGDLQLRALDCRKGWCNRRSRKVPPAQEEMGCTFVGQIQIACTCTGTKL